VLEAVHLGGISTVLELELQVLTNSVVEQSHGRNRVPGNAPVADYRRPAVPTACTVRFLPERFAW
jgi:hypothetical protein